MKDLISAMAEEKAYVADRLKNINTSLVDRLTPYGYSNLTEYFADKQEHLFNEWIPEVYPIDVRNITADLEAAVRNEKYGIYLSYADGLYAFHGSLDIDHTLCEELGICVAELYHTGGTIIGSNADLGIEIIAPKSVGLTSGIILKKFQEIISKYIDGVTIAENDILVNGDKVMGSMQRQIGNTFVWAAQVSFRDYTDIITQVCNKQIVKKPSHIDSTLLTRDVLESEVIAWLQKR